MDRRGKSAADAQIIFGLTCGIEIIAIAARVPVVVAARFDTARGCADGTAEHHSRSSALDRVAAEGRSTESSNCSAEKGAAHGALTKVRSTAVWICRTAAEKRQGEQARQKRVFH